jgi:polysaccharide biosynthesis protein PslH
VKLLFVTLFFPHAKARHAGGRYVYEVLSRLSGRHELHLATRLEESELGFLPSVRPLCRSIYPYTYPSLTERGSWDTIQLVGNYLGFSRFADRLIAEGDYDVVQVEWVEAALLIRRRETPLVLDAHDVISKPAERRMRQTKGVSRLWAAGRYLLTRAVERRIMRRFDRIFAVSEFDRDYLLRMAPELSGRVRSVPIPAGMDITEQPYERKPDAILFLAAYRHRQVNVEAALWFYREVFPRVRREVPNARFIIAGNGPPDVLTVLPEGDNQVEVPGFVEDIDRCYKEAAVFVAPILTGGGIIVKVLDALAAGTPVVTTTFGNEGVGAEPGRDLLVADDPQEFAAQVVRVLRDPQCGRDLAASGSEFVRRRYGLDMTIAKLEEHLSELANAGGAV